MTISYNWLNDFLPEIIEPEKLSRILTAIGLEVESLEKHQTVKGGLEGVVVGEVLTCEQHPNADKLKITTVNIGAAEPLQIVCGAANVAATQKVLVATVGTTLYPATGEPMTMKVAKIRGVESFGMICAEDELGMGNSHDGILVLPATTIAGTKAVDYFQITTDWVYEIGLTPNRMDAMSHYGVARDVCAYLAHHNKNDIKVKTNYSNSFKADKPEALINVTVEDTVGCQRYAGVSISDITVKESPQWLKNRLIAIGQRPINNIVDITNYVLHEYGQPLHAFDAAQIAHNDVVVKCLPVGTLFTTLDGKERKLDAEDIMICNGKGEGMCIGGVFGGLHSGVTDKTTSIFLESAWFNPISIRKTSLRHQLRTDAATRFEKGVDISQSVQVLKRAALLIKEIAGGEICGDIIDVYPQPKQKQQVSLKYHYLKKISGKNYHPDAVKRILTALGFEIAKEGIDEIWLTVPYSKLDIQHGADIVEEIIRIDGLDNIEIPQTIHISPAVQDNVSKELLREKITGALIGQGFNEIITNSITNSKYYSEEVLGTTVKMLNNLSADLDVLRPSMLETGLESIAYNLNRKSNNLAFFEWGKTYTTTAVGKYIEEEWLALFLTGKRNDDEWSGKGQAYNLFHLKGVVQNIANLCGVQVVTVFNETTDALDILANKKIIGQLTQVNEKQLQNFDIKQPVFYATINTNLLIHLSAANKLVYKEVSKFPVVQRDLALVLDTTVTYATIEATVQKLKLGKLQNMRLFDVFESDKLGEGKKSMAINFTFSDEEKTLTDKEIDGMVQKLVQVFEKDLNASIRK